MAPYTRRCGESETMFHFLQAMEGVGLVGYTLSVSTEVPLEEAVVRQALSHLWRKIITLRLLVTAKEDDVNPWFTEMEDEVIDLEKIPWDDVESTLETLRATPMDTSQGPVWKVRMTSTPDKLQHKFLFVFHHSITDGTSSCKIVGHFMNFLNDILAEREIDDEEQLTSHTDSEACTSEFSASFMKEWEENPVVKEKLWNDFDDIISQSPLILKAGLQEVEETAPTTVSCHHDFTEKETENFLLSCKLHKITVHMAFSIAAQIAMLDLLQKKGINRDSYEMVTQHAMNLRRYYKGNEDHSEKFGFAVGMLPIKFTLPTDAKSSFWNLCKDFKTIFSTGIEEVTALKSYLHLVEKFTENPEMMNAPPFSYLDATNMGDITRSVTGNFAKENPETEEDKLAKLTHIIRSSSVHATGSITLLNLQSFKGRLLFSIDCNTKYLSREAAMLYQDCFVDVMRYAANNP